ncbi:T6SS immunity protein Tdi1 domain-containing protein [Cystobacter ferrugineus]|uniref:T6SS immunity protein Tdi1 C-terminal domain-containing protein n=1 Tax=Cystobacter ferrugineus TaxID=83449 RepID=A0A1L9BKT1_9BACT|nr:T6SS immunity protein Tdi1 domain-containing protein [Cystobacter ferrugineus]OJH42806.1 hypothetical protein BON30_06435 [Cystobacter ferrugineus]
MFERFSRKYQLTFQETLATGGDLTVSPLERIPGFEEFMARYEGATFDHGLYRVHLREQRTRWTARAEEAFPTLKGRVSCFAYDWLGRQFALDNARRQGGQPLILLLEIGTGEILEIPLTFADFHENELVDDPDAALLPGLFQDWLALKHNPPRPHECVGYKTPLFLGGADTLDNMESTDMDVYWTLFGQMLAKVRNLPEGTPIKGFTV